MGSNRGVSGEVPVLTLKEKIISCFGKLNQKSTAIVCGTSPPYVCVVWAKSGLNYKRRNEY